MEWVKWQGLRYREETSPTFKEDNVMEMSSFKLFLRWIEKMILFYRSLNEALDFHES